MALTDKQRARVSNLRNKGYLEATVVEMMGVTLADVRSVNKGGGRPRKTTKVMRTRDEQHAHDALKAALKIRREVDRLGAVKCVLANFGDLLGMAVDEAEIVILGHVNEGAK